MSKLAMHWIDGEWTASASGGYAQSIDPATGNPVGSFADGGDEEAEAAIRAARTRFDTSDWAHQPKLRATVLLEFADQLEAHRETLARMLTQENGKLLREAEGEVAASISEARYYAGLARNIFGRVAEMSPGTHSMLAREPIGVVAIIVPWNAPITLLVRSLAPALAAGCTCVVKAAPQTAIVNEAVFRLLSAVNALPSGVVNMFCETGHAGAKLLVSSPEVDAISYTGSTEVGKQIMAAGAPTLKRLNLELGGNAPCVVFPDADVNLAVPAIARAGMVMAGQMCVAASRILVHETMVDALSHQLARELRSLVVGPGSDRNSDIGPMIDMASRGRFMEKLATATESEEAILVGEPLKGTLATGSFLSPSLIRVRNLASPLVSSEVFGPVLTIETFRDEEEAVAMANCTRFGLAASVWTADLQKALRVCARIKSGTVWINSHLRLYAEIETGGYRESGIGRLHGIEGLEAFLQTKHVSWSTQ